MDAYDEQKEVLVEQLNKALDHLEYSFNKIQSLSTKVAELDNETLETWESFCARFSRVSDLFLMKYLRTAILQNDPAFRGSLRDHVNLAEKLELLDDAEAWMQIRSLQNVSSYDYNDSDMEEFLRALKKECPRLLSINLAAKS